MTVPLTHIEVSRGSHLRLWPTFSPGVPSTPSLSVAQLQQASLAYSVMHTLGICSHLWLLRLPHVHPLSI